MKQTDIINHMNFLSSVAQTSVNNSAKLAAMIVYKGRVISVGTNERKTHPFQAKYGKNGDSIYMHAEISVIKDAIKILSLKEMSKATLLVCRIKRPGAQSKEFIPAMAKPCEGCRRCIYEFGIKETIYSMDSSEKGYEIL